MVSAEKASGPLRGLRVLEFASIGPGPYCGMLLADLGAEVVRIERPGGNGWPNAIIDRGRHFLQVDMTQDEGQTACRAVADKADVLMEGFRPGVMERWGLGPDTLLARNPRLVFARMTGWGQTGPLSKAAAHDINFIALTGALAAMGPPQGPSVPPLNLVGDLGGGAMLLAFGIMAALWERESSGKGQVIDAAIVDSVASMMSMFAGLAHGGPAACLDRGANLLGGAAPFYRCYTCADGREIALGALEPKFYEQLLEKMGAPAEFRENQYDRSTWPARCEALAKIIALKTRAQWCELLEGSDVCFAPVLTLGESQAHAHMAHRGCHAQINGLTQTTPVPRFSRTPGAVAQGGHAGDLLKRWGVSGHEVAMSPMTGQRR